MTERVRSRFVRGVRTSVVGAIMAAAVVTNCSSSSIAPSQPFRLPLIGRLDIEFTSPVTFFVGENGTGKSTVSEAIAALCRLPVSRP
jgi:hypothetical protein